MKFKGNHSTWSTLTNAERKYNFLKTFRQIVNSNDYRLSTSRITTYPKTIFLYITIVYNTLGFCFFAPKSHLVAKSDKSALAYVIVLMKKILYSEKF